MRTRFALTLTLSLALSNSASSSDHWSFSSPKRSTLPAAAPGDPAGNEIDRFVLARLAQHELRPSTRADRLTEIRRLSLDLRGLPPSIEEADAYLADESPDAWARLVDRFLRSAAFGERMAQDWLDLARYGDTNGFHGDSDRDMWLYRDYVIESFQKNLPFDRFIVENLAGDLLPEADDRTRVASGFNRCNTFNEEGGADPDEFYVHYAVDRTNTMGQVFLGLTLGCAQCHDHKYDPISQKEYYEIYAFFNSVEGEIGAGGQAGYHNKPLPPLLFTYSAKQLEEMKKLEAEVAAIEGELVKTERAILEGEPSPESVVAQRAWEEGVRGNRAPESPGEEGLALWLDASDLDGDRKNDEGRESREIASWRGRTKAHHEAKSSGKPKLVPGALNGKPGVRLDGAHDYLRTPKGGESLRGDFTMVVVCRLDRLDAHQMLLMWGEEATGKRRALWKTSGKNQVSFNGYHRDVIGAGVVKAAEPFVATITKKGGENEIRFFLNGQEAGSGKTALEAFGSTAITIGANNAGNEKTTGVFGDVLVYSRALEPEELDRVGHYLASKYGIAGTKRALPKPIEDALQIAESERSDQARRLLREHFLRRVDTSIRAKIEPIEKRLASKREALAKVRSAKSSTMVMVEKKKRTPAFVLMRGDFQHRGQEVDPNVPRVFPKLPKDAPRSRLGLAQWLVSADHPLTARVAVNRIWQQLFGVGLVKTAGDFGTRGERPSHPELLDWLAVEFVESGWDVHSLVRKIVSSSTYRQGSRSDWRYDRKDPENRLLWRAPRVRLSAEGIRDMALAASGLLSREVGGRSVRPFQPAGYFRDKVGRDWKIDSGANYYRRGLYTYWRRTPPYPAFQIFDAPSREFCTVSRPRTNTPLQALVTMNDPTFIEAARQLAERALELEPEPENGDESARLRHVFRRVLTRPPEVRELAVLRLALDEQRANYRADVDAAKKLVAIGPSKSREGTPPEELAAWTAVASIVLNLDEAITKE